MEDMKKITCCFGGGICYFFLGGLNLDSRKFVFNLTLGWGMMR